MPTGSSKKVLVLKNLSSDMIEEAILILKSEPAGEVGIAAKSSKTEKKRAEDSIMKEAEKIINNYIMENKLTGYMDFSKKADKKSKRNKKWVNTAINAALVGSLILLYIIVSKMF